MQLINAVANSDNDFSSVTQENLSTYLRDIHLPEPVAWWPLAPAWWVLILLALLIIAIAFIKIGKKRVNKNRLIQELDNIYRRLQKDGNAAAYSTRVTRLLREVANSGADKETVASLQGNSWVGWMERVSGITFSHQARQFLSDECYKQNPESPGAAVHSELCDWTSRYLVRSGERQGQISA